MIGKRLGNYEVLDKLGEGGMGEVWRARDERLHRMVAVKILPHELGEDPSRRARFEQEAHALGALNHPNIVTIYDVGQDDGRAYIVSELVEGEPLRAMLDRGPLPMRKAIDIASQIADGMAAAHALGIVHRDLKPENVMVTRFGQVKLLDFGLAKQSARATGENTATMALSQPGTVLGTAGYMSPEQVRAEQVDARSDIFSFGSMLYEMVTGRRAFEASTSVETMHAILKLEPPEFEGELGKLPPALATIVRRCLEKRPEQRFQSAADLAFALRSITGISITGAQAAIATTQPARKRWLWPLVAVAGGVALFAAGFFLRDRTINRAQPQFQRITFRRGLVGRARFTPDGNIVYSASWDNDPGTIYLSVPGSPESRDLGVRAGLASVSSRQELAITTGPHGDYNSSRLSISSISGGQTRPLLDGVLAADWAPGASMAVLRRVNGINRLEYPVGHVLISNIPWVLWMLRISPDGNRVAFAGMAEGTAIGLYVAERTGEHRMLGLVSGQNSTGEDSDLCWSPKGDEIWFRSFNVGESGIVYALDLQGHRRIALNLPTRVRFFDISRTGQALLSTGSVHFGILGMAPGDKQERDLSCLDSGAMAGISDDGQTIVANVTGENGTSKGSIYLRKTDGSPPIRVSDGHAYKLSPDGKWISGYVLNANGSRRFVLLPTGPGEPIELNVPEVKPATVFGWLEGEERYLVVGRRPGKKFQCFAFDGQHGSLRPVCPEGILDSLSFRLSPDGKQFLSPASQGAWVVYSVDGGPPQPVRGITSTENVIGWRSDSRSLWIRPDIDSATNIPVSILDISTGKKTPWKEIHPTQPVVEIHDLYMTPDGLAYAYNYVLMQSDLYLARGLF